MALVSSKLFLILSIYKNAISNNPVLAQPGLIGSQYTSYVKIAVCQPSDAIRHPQSVSDVVAIVKEAIAKRTTVKAFGHRHSASDIICTDGIPVDMRGLRGIKLHSDFTTTVGAGVYMYDFTHYLKQRGRALKTTPAFGNITIGGAIGTGAHGSSIKYNSSISSQVVGLTIVDGLGKIQKISSEEDLRAFRVHLGLLGIVVDVTLNTEPLYKVRAFNYLVSDDIMTNGKIVEIARSTDQVTAYWFPSFKKVLIANWTIVDAKRRGKAFTYDHVPSTSKTFNAYAIPTYELIQASESFFGLQIFQGYSLLTMITKVPDYVPIYTENGITVQNPAVGFYDRMFAPICKDNGFHQCPWFHGPHNNLTFLDNEITLPLDRLSEFAATVKDIVSKTPGIFPNGGILLRFSAASSIYMSTSQGYDACHFEFYMVKRRNSYINPSLGLTAYQTILQTLAGRFGGRSHWGKSGLYYHSTDMIAAKLDPAARASFIAKMKQYDPNGLFLNSFGKRLKGEGTKIDFDPRTTHCALLDNCVCSDDDDCARSQVCSSVDGYEEYPVCKNTIEKFGAFEALWNPLKYLKSPDVTLDKLFCSAGDLSLNILNALNCSISAAIDKAVDVINKLPIVDKLPKLPIGDKVSKLPFVNQLTKLPIIG